VCRGSNGDRSKAGPAPRPTKEGYSTDALQEAGSLLLRKCHDIYPCSRLALQVGNPLLLPVIGLLEYASCHEFVSALLFSRLV